MKLFWPDIVTSTVKCSKVGGVPESGGWKSPILSGRVFFSFCFFCFGGIPHTNMYILYTSHKHRCYIFICTCVYYCGTVPKSSDTWPAPLAPPEATPKSSTACPGRVTRKAPRWTIFMVGSLTRTSLSCKVSHELNPKWGPGGNTSKAAGLQFPPPRHA